MTADSKGDGGWGDEDPSVFVLEISGRLHGEFQVTNGYGPDKATQVMKVGFLSVDFLSSVNLILIYFEWTIRPQSIYLVLSRFEQAYFEGVYIQSVGFKVELLITSYQSSTYLIQ